MSVENFNKICYRKRAKQKIAPLPYSIEPSKKYLFLVDDKEWTVEDVMGWFYLFKETFNNDIVILPKSMISTKTTITSKEYTVLNNILKRMGQDKRQKISDWMENIESKEE